MPLLLVDPPAPIHAGEEVRVSCESQGGNPEPTLSLYLGSEQLGSSATAAISESFVASPEHHEAVLACHAVNSVMDSPVEQSLLLEVLCKYIEF